MFSKKIEFSAPEEITRNKHLHPTPIKFNLPDWFKKLEHKTGHRTVKGCVPFLETLITGYLLKVPVEFILRHNKFSNNNERQTEAVFPSNTMEGTEPIFSNLSSLKFSIFIFQSSLLKGITWT